MTATPDNRRVVHFVTPENIEVTYELAGFGSRFVAALIDHLLQAALILLVWTISSQFSHVLSFAGVVGGSASAWIRAAAMLAIFAIMFGYFVFFELRTGGQSPGKRIARLRVVRNGGYPIDPYSSVIRNLVRIVDLGVPPPYGAGMASIFASREYKRLGDFAAGTIVIKERPIEDPPHLGAPGPLVVQLIPLIQDVDQLSSEEYEVIRRFVERRAELAFPLQVDFAMRIAVPLMQKLGITVPIVDQAHFPDLIEAIDRRYREEKGIGAWQPTQASPEPFV